MGGELGKWTNPGNCSHCQKNWTDTSSGTFVRQCRCHPYDWYHYQCISDNPEEIVYRAALDEAEKTRIVKEADEWISRRSAGGGLSPGSTAPRATK